MWIERLQHVINPQYYIWNRSQIPHRVTKTTAMIPLLTFLGSLSLESIQHPIDTPLTYKGRDKWHHTSWQEWSGGGCCQAENQLRCGEVGVNQGTAVTMIPNTSPNDYSRCLRHRVARTGMRSFKTHCEIVVEKGHLLEVKKRWASLFPPTAVTICGCVSIRS